MRYLYAILLLFLQNAFSQDSKPSNKLTFQYDIGHSSWGKSGVYANTEKIEFLQTENGDYKVQRHLKVQSKVRGKVFTKDTITLNKSFTISQNRIKELLGYLNRNEENYTAAFIVPKLKKPSERLILKIAKRDDNKWKIKNNYSDKEDREKIFSSIQNFEGFEEFISIDKPNVNIVTVTSDAWNLLQITIVENGETFTYKSQLFENFGQPISLSNNSQIINLEVNLKIQEILPKNTLIYNALDLNEITEKYISWYLESKI